MRRKVFGVPVIALVVIAALVGGAAAAYAALTRVSNIVEWDTQVVQPTPTPTSTRIPTGGEVELSGIHLSPRVDIGQYDYFYISVNSVVPDYGSEMEVDLRVVAYPWGGLTPSPSMLTADIDGEELTFVVVNKALVASLEKLNWSRYGSYYYTVRFKFNPGAHAAMWKWNVYAMAED